MGMNRVEKLARFSSRTIVLEICAALRTLHVPDVTYRIRDSIVMGIFWLVSIRLVSRRASVARDLSSPEVKSEIAIESPKFPSRKPRKGSYTGTSRLCTSRLFGRRKISHVRSDDDPGGNFTNDRRRPERYIPLLSCNIHGSVHRIQP